jgi:hydroxymethylglutaryl-CoA synthase
MTTAPSNVGILAMEMYFPKRYVSQEDMEIANNCIGKYTKGLGQVNMAFTDDIEDINSIFLTVTHALFEKYNINPNDIGRLEIGTETLLDKAKSVKTSLMRLFGDNTELEGVTNVNACYGGTAALFNCMDWIKGPEWNGKYALVVCGDIAVYAEGPARCTGGCGSIAYLIGPNAPLVFESGVRSTHSLDVYDFYKPSCSEYAKVNGTLSQWVYLSSVDTCYTRYKAKFNKLHPNEEPMTVDRLDYFAYHSPYNKLVQKGFSRLFYVDFMENPTKPGFETAAEIKDIPREQTYDNAGKAEMVFRNIAAPR